MTRCATAVSTTAAWASTCRWPVCSNCTSNSKRLPFDIEVVAFAEEEGQRYKATFLGSSALTGTSTRPGWTRWMRTASHARRCNTPGVKWTTSPRCNAMPADYQGFVEVHIEQGPVLNELDMPLGIVTSINASARFQVRGASAWPATPAPHPWTAAAMRQPPWPS
jgi:hypothetical protein